LRKRFDTPEGSALRDWVEELELAHETRNFTSPAGRTGQIERNEIYAFPDHYLSAERDANGLYTAFALTYHGRKGLYLMEEVTRAVMSEDGVTISEAQVTSEMDADGKAILYGVQFDVGSAVLRPTSEASLEIIANVLRERPGRFYIVGHTSDTGGFELNMRLSAERAQAIIDALGARYGIDTSRLQAAGVGPVAPLASNQNEAGRQLNRRVELVERLEE
ncbi:MAG: OmpA family protein, partial [Pseudomonadota bacterium]